MKLWLCLRFDQLPLQSLERSEDRPLAVTERQRLLCVNDYAAGLGLQPDMGIATARALCGDQPLQLLARDTAAEARSLQSLCCWAYGITPTLHSWHDNCLLLEIGGCLRLFGGIHSLLAQVNNGISSRGYRAHQGLAETPRAAWLFSFCDAALALDLAQDLASRLAPLPLELLAPLSTEVPALMRAGIRSLGDLLGLPQQALGKRCGKDFIHLLAQISGRAHDGAREFTPPDTFRDSYTFGYEVSGSEEMQPAIQLLLQSLCLFLRNTQQQTRELNWLFIGARGQQQLLCVRSTDGLVSAQGWQQLTHTRMERYPLQQPVEEVVLQCPQLEGAVHHSVDLFSSATGDEPLNSLLDRLRSRLGMQAIKRLGCRSEHLPEYAVHTAADGVAAGGAALAASAQRPFWLLSEPQRVVALGNGRLRWNQPLELIYGPERIEDYWWEKAVSRDYFIAQASAGERYWVFYDRLQREWFLHGIFA